MHRLECIWVFPVELIVVDGIKRAQEHCARRDEVLSKLHLTLGDPAGARTGNWLDPKTLLHKHGQCLGAPPWPLQGKSW